MEDPQEYFYAHYDVLVPKIFEPYNELIGVAANLVPTTASSVAEFGIGTGNFSREVQARNPNVRVYGVDKNPQTLEIAGSRLQNFTPYCRDFFEGDLPTVDYFISSLAMHHLPTETRRDKLLSLAQRSKGFVNFDFALIDGASFDDVVSSVLNYSSRSFDFDSLRIIEGEMRANDNYMSLDEQAELFTSEDFDFRVHAIRKPFVVYSVFPKGN